MPNTTVIRGSLIPYIQEESWDVDPNGGFIHRLLLRGASQDLMQAAQANYTANGIACRLIYNQGDTATLEVEDSTQQLTIDVWQIVGNTENRDGLSHPNLISTLSNAGYNPYVIINSMRENLNNQADPSSLFTGTGIFAGLSSTAKSEVQLFYNLQVTGATDYRHDQYVLRHTTNAPNRWNSNISDIGVGAIYTTAELLTETQNSALWVYPIPGRLSYKINAIDQVPASGGIRPVFQTGYLFGWLKSASTETTAANNRVDITTEYTLEQWPVGTGSIYSYYYPF